MGVCIRTGATLILDLPTLFWKELVGQKVNLDDFYEIDVRQVNKWRDLLKMDKQTFEMLDCLQWTATNADGTEVNLKPNGNELSVKHEEIEEYILRSLEARLSESKAQYQAIKRGISKIIPPSILNIVTAKELEIWICFRDTRSTQAAITRNTL